MDAQIKLARAIEELEAGRTPQAQTILVGLVKDDPEYTEAWLALASCFDDPEKKEFCINRAISSDPTNAEARRALAELRGEEPPVVFGDLDEISMEDAEEQVEAPIESQVEAPVEEEGLQADEIQADETQADYVQDGEIAAAGAFIGTASAADELAPEIQEAPETEAPAEQPVQPLDPWDIPAAAEEAFTPEPEPYPWEIPPEDTPQEPAAWEIPAEPSEEAAEPWSAPEIPAEGIPIAPSETAPSTAKPEEIERRIAWYVVWFMAVFPSQSGWRKILADPQGRPGRGFLWVFVTSFIGLLISVLVFAFQMRDLLPGLFTQYPELAMVNPQQLLGYVLIGMLVGSPIMAGLSVLGVMIAAGLYQFVAKFFIGVGTFGEMAYALSAIYAPVSLVSAFFSLLMMALASIGGAGLMAVYIVNGLFGIYVIYLQLAAIKGVNRFGWGASCGTFIAVPLIIGVCACLIGLLIVTSGAGLQGVEGLPLP